MILNNKGRYIKEKQKVKRVDVREGLQDRIDKIAKSHLIDRIMNRYSTTKDKTPHQYKTELQELTLRQLVNVFNNL
jgi:hypothetical protein